MFELSNNGNYELRCSNLIYALQNQILFFLRKVLVIQLGGWNKFPIDVIDKDLSLYKFTSPLQKSNLVYMLFKFIINVNFVAMGLFNR